MKKTTYLCWAIPCLASLSLASAETVRHPVNVGVSLEQSRTFLAVNPISDEYAPTFAVRPTGWIFGRATVNERTDLVFGLGATVFSLTHHTATYPGGYENEVYPAVGMVRATATYTWGDLKDPSLKATVGAMPYKYNPDSKELGEYLLRSTPYPNTLLNSPFDLVNVAHADFLGASVSKYFAGGKWQNDLLLTSSTSHPPFGDLSLAYLTRYTVNSMLELGAGVNLFRLIPVQSALNTYKNPSNAYFIYSNGKEYSTLSGHYSGADSAIADSVFKALQFGTPLPSGVSGVHYYATNGQSLMARFSIDFKPVLGENIPLKLYGEWAMLGVKNYPVFYEKPLDRMPFMLGLNIPTWGLLDLLNVEAEYWKNPYFNADYNMTDPDAGYGGLATPFMADAGYLNLGLSKLDAIDGDDFKWSISATKSISKVLSITAKASQDHMQVMQLRNSHFDRSGGDIMSGKDSWYYVLRLQAAI